MAKDAHTMLAEIRVRLDAGLSWEEKRDLVELLMRGVIVQTNRRGKKSTVEVSVRYVFSLQAVGRGWR